MALYYLDPTREPRECPGCLDCDLWNALGSVGTPRENVCHGTGRLGARVGFIDDHPAGWYAFSGAREERDGDAEAGPFLTKAKAESCIGPDVEIAPVFVHPLGDPGYQWSFIGPLGDRRWHGTYPTEAAALAEAREEHRFRQYRERCRAEARKAAK